MKVPKYIPDKHTPDILAQHESNTAKLASSKLLKYLF